MAELSVAVHRYAVYPRHHPSLEPAAISVLQKLRRILDGAPSLTLDSVTRQISLGKGLTRPFDRSFVELWGRLQDESIRSITITKGAVPGEIEGFLATISGRAEEHGVASLDWPHISVSRAASEPWDQKASAAVSVDSAALAARVQELSEDILGFSAVYVPQELMDAEEGDLDGAVSDRVFVERLVPVLRELASASHEPRIQDARSSISSVFTHLDSSALTEMLSSLDGCAERKEVVRHALAALEPAAALKMLHSAANIAKRPLSGQLSNLLKELAHQAGDRESPESYVKAEEAFQGVALELLRQWSDNAPATGHDTTVLDAIGRALPTANASFGGFSEASGPHRLLQMAMEVDTFSPLIGQAVGNLMGRGEGPFVLKLIDEAPTGHRLALRIKQYLMDPSLLRELLRGEDVDVNTLRSLTRRIGARAVSPLLESLLESDSKSVRRKVFDQLAEMGSSIAPQLVERLGDARWFVRRNLLALLGKFSELPSDFDPIHHLEHSDVRVRVEAYRIAVRLPQLRERALVKALADEDERLVRVALLDLQDGLPDRLVDHLVRQVTRDERTSEVRVLAARALAATGTDEAIEGLVMLTATERMQEDESSVWTLRERSPALLIALQALARGWPDHPRVAEVLAIAQSDDDADIRSAAETPREADV